MNILHVIEQSCADFMGMKIVPFTFNEQHQTIQICSMDSLETKRDCSFLKVYLKK